jgi:hypothetical protein
MLMALGCGCLLALGISLAPRLALILAWIFSDRWAFVWQGNWFIPLLGIILAPFTTVMYMLAWDPVVGVAGWDWIWVALGAFLDIMNWSQNINVRKQVPGYPATAP